MPALLEKIASTRFSQKLAQFLVPHENNQHRPWIIRHESLFAFTFVILLVQFFSFSGISSARVLGYGTDINKETIITLTNQERTSRGLGALKENAQLDQSASLKGADMFAKDYWAHFAPDGTSPWYFFKQAGYDYSWAGENLARDFSTSAGVVAGWMASTGHRENMLNPNFVDIGISVSNGTLGGDQTTLVVEHLGKTADTVPASPPTTLNSSTSQQPAAVNDSQKQASSKPLVATASANTTKVSETVGSAFPNTIFNLKDFWDELGLGQRTTLLLLGLLAAVFVFDAILIYRKGKFRENSHSLLHAFVLAILMIALIRSAGGGIL